MLKQGRYSCPGHQEKSVVLCICSAFQVNIVDLEEESLADLFVR